MLNQVSIQAARANGSFPSKNVRSLLPHDKRAIAPAIPCYNAGAWPHPQDISRREPQQPLPVANVNDVAQRLVSGQQCAVN